MALGYGEVLYIFLTSRSAPVIALYFLLVFLSPRLRKLFLPLELRIPLLLHNLFCSLLSLYVLCYLVIGFWPVWDFFSNEEDTGAIRHGMFVYWLSKVYELMDTVFMVLRHRVRQISVLHVFHHSTITLLADWCAFRTPMAAFVPVLAMNSFVHVIMYGYYFLTTVYPLHAFTWKRRITQMQMVQFLLGMVQSVIGYLYHSFCVYSVLYGLGMFLLFSNFYYHAFIVKKMPKVLTVKDAENKTK